MDKIKGLELEVEDQHQPAHEAPELVSLRDGGQKLDAETVEFSINQHSEEYATFVRGRTVLGHILAPASVYMESAARAFSLLPNRARSDSSPHSTVDVSDVKLHAPFGLNLRRRLRLTLVKRTDSRWHFVVESHSCDQYQDEDLKLQASGTVGWQGQERAYLGPHRPLLRRLYDRCEQLRDDRSGSLVQGAFVKNIMGRVVSYDDSYFGIQSVTCKTLEAVGDVAVPLVLSQCRAATLFSPPAFDNFLLVAELHASSLGDLADDRSYICSGFDAVVPQICPGDPASDAGGPWTVLSSLDRVDDKTLVCDIFVFAAGRKTLSLVILGARFVRVSLVSLQRTLEALHEIGDSSSGSVSSTSKVPTGTQGASIGPRYAVDDASGCQDNAQRSQRARGDVLANVISGQMRQDLRCASLSSTSQRTPTDDGKDTDFLGATSISSLVPAGSDAFDENQAIALFNLLKDHLNCSQEISPSTPLGTAGLDSLVAIQLRSDIEKLFGRGTGPMDIDENSTFSDLCGMVFHQDSAAPRESRPLPAMTAESRSTSNGLDGHKARSACVVSAPESKGIFLEPSAFITRATSEFAHVRQDPSFAQRTGFAGFFPEVYQKQMSLVLAYILEAFGALGCDLSTLGEGEPLPLVFHLPKHDRLLARLQEMLEHAGLIARADSQSPYSRTGKPVAQARPAANLYQEILDEHPRYRPDHQLLNVTASRLADCLVGRVDPLQLLFRDEASVQLLADVYVNSPMFATGNEMLGGLVSRLVSQGQRNDEGLRILEIGAGTGATAQLVLDKLLASNADFTYTFTDVSVALIAGARRKLEAKYGPQRMKRHMEFAPLDIEQSPPASMTHSYDLVISSNCIHATRNLEQSCANIEKLLRRSGGMLCLLELTRPLGWLDCVFGLLDGWWRFNDGRRYALMREHEWEATLRDVGLRNVDWTDDGSQESQQFRLITAWR